MNLQEIRNKTGKKLDDYISITKNNECIITNGVDTYDVITDRNNNITLIKLKI